MNIAFEKHCKSGLRKLNNFLPKQDKETLIDIILQAYKTLLRSEYEEECALSILTGDKLGSRLVYDF